MNDDLLDVRTAARLLGLSRQRVYQLIWKKKLHPVRSSHPRYVLRREEIHRFRDSLRESHEKQEAAVSGGSAAEALADPKP